MSAAGVPFWAWGLIVLDPWITAFGVAVQMFAKLWFLDRMALLYDDVVGPSGGLGPHLHVAESPRATTPSYVLTISSTKRAGPQGVPSSMPSFRPHTIAETRCGNRSPIRDR